MAAHIDVDLIDPHPLNPRHDLGDLDSLATSIQEVGLLEPIIVVPAEGRYRVVAGHRRLEASRMIGCTEIRAEVRTDLNETEALRALMIENLQRQDLNVGEEAQGVLALQGMGLTQKEIGRSVGRSKSWVSSRSRLGDLTPAAAKVVTESGLSVEAAMDLAALCRLVADKQMTKKALNEVLAATRRTPGNSYAIRDALRSHQATEIMGVLLAGIPEDVRYLEPELPYGAEPDDLDRFNPRKHRPVGEDSYRSVVVDPKAHEGEPCHAVRLGTKWKPGTAGERVQYLEPVCTTPARHAWEGASELKADGAEATHEARVTDRAVKKSRRESKATRTEQYQAIIQERKIPAKSFRSTLVALAIARIGHDGVKAGGRLLGLEPAETQWGGQDWQTPMSAYAAQSARNEERAVLAMLLSVDPLADDSGDAQSVRPEWIGSRQVAWDLLHSLGEIG